MEIELEIGWRLFAILMMFVIGYWATVGAKNKQPPPDTELATKLKLNI